MRPNPGAHSLDTGLPLGVILRDILKLATTTAEVKKILHNNEVLVDGKQRKDHHHMIGLFDVLSLPSLNKYYRITLDLKGRIIIIEIPKTESNVKLCKVMGKTILTKGRLQLNLHDGKNILSEKPVKVGDSLVLTLPQLEVKEVLSLQPGMTIFLTKGKHAGSQGELKEIRKNEAIYFDNDKEVETSRNYLFVIGSKKPVMKITEKKITEEKEK